MYVGLSALGLNTAPFAVSPITSLFQNGEPGAVFIASKPTQDWITNPNLVTMYQDAAGTTPVTALEQPVGLHLDTRPIFLGPNIATVTSIVGDVAGGPAFTNYSTGAIPTPGKTYQITFSTTNYSGTGSVGVAGASPVQWTTTPVNTLVGNGTVSYTLTRGSDASAIQVFTRSTNTATFTNISVREVQSAPNAVGQPLRGNQLWSDGTTSFTGEASRVSAGVYRIFSSAGAISAVYQNAAPVIGATYEVTFNIDSITTVGGGVTVTTTAGLTTFTSVGPKRLIYVADNTTAIGLKRATGVATDIQVSNLQFKLLYGNHRSQATTGARAKLSARYNKIAARNANPVDLTNVTLGNATNGLATLTVVNDAAALSAAGLSGVCTLGNVYKLDNTAGNGQAFINFGGQCGNTNSQKYGAYVRFAGAGGGGINLTGGTSPGSSSTAYVRLTEAATPTLATNGMYGYVNAGAVGFFILPDLREACYSYLPTPQVVWDATTGYDDAGFPARIVYSGAQGYATGAVDFSGSDKAQMMWGGAKLSDTTTAVIMEIGGGAVAGSFHLYGPLSAGTAEYAANSMGTSSISGSMPTGVASPNASVITGLTDISAPYVIGRVNGVQQANATGSQGTGVYLNSALAFGSRNADGATFPFRGDEFVSIVRGGNTPSTGTIYSVEQAVGRYMGMNI